jgi:glycosyltransferase involved in cell wall biosynthesis
MPRVSIIVPAYNAAQWLRETLESALAQTHADKEIIVVDDGSRDGTMDATRSFSGRGIRVVTQPNRGPAAARNHGLRLATGDFIQYLDADDLLAPDKIAAQIRRLDRNPSLLASCRWGRFRQTITDTVFADDGMAADFKPIDFLLLHVGLAKMMHPAAWLVPRGIAEKAGLWDEELSLNDDGEYFARVVLASGGIISVPEVCSYYRSGLSGSLSRTRSPAALKSLERSVEKVSHHISEAEDSPRTRRALAEYWQRLEYEIYPQGIEICRRARQRSRALGGARLPPAAGRREKLLAMLLGWRLARRIRFLTTLSHV